MIFCDSALAMRIEAAECQLLKDACANVAHRVADVFAREICGGFAAFTEPGSPLNKVTGLGTGATFDEKEFVGVEEAHQARGAAIQVELATLAEPRIAKWLTGRGYELVGVENVLGLKLPAPARNSAAGSLDISHSSLGELNAWLELIVAGFAVPDVQGVAAHEEYDRAVLRNVVRDFAQADGVLRYTAMSEGTPVGAATMRIFAGIAQLCGAATLQQHRRRGVQSALLDQRLIEATRAGCEIAVVTTQPGSKSQQNAQRQGFELLYARNVLRREPR